MESNKNIKLHPGVQIVEIDSRRIQLRSPLRSDITFDSNSEEIKEILSLLDGEKSLEQIVKEENVRRTGPDLVTELLQLLQESGFLVAATEKVPEGAFLSAMDMRSRKIAPLFKSFQNKSGDERTARFNLDTIVIEGNGMVADSVRYACEHIGIANINRPSNTAQTLVVCCSDNINFTYFRELNRKYVENKIPIVFIHLDDLKLNIGPLVIAGETACFECVYFRKQAGLRFMDEFEARARIESAKTQAVDKEDETVAAFLCYAATYMIAALKGSLFDIFEPGRVYSFKLNEFKSDNHIVTRLPRCPVCGISPGNQVLQAVRNMS